MYLVHLSLFLSSKFGYMRFNFWLAHSLFQRLCMPTYWLVDIFHPFRFWNYSESVSEDAAAGFVDTEFDVASVCCELIATAMGKELHSYLHFCHLERTRWSRDVHPCGWSLLRVSKFFSNWPILRTFFRWQERTFHKLNMVHGDKTGKSVLHNLVHKIPHGVLCSLLSWLAGGL
jgi:hypothetical protein